MELSDFTRAKEGSVRITTVLKNLVAVTSIFVRGFEFTAAGLILDVRPTWRRPRCCQCRRRGAGYDTQAPRRWRHFGLGSLRIWLRYAPRRVHCRHCGAIRVEHLPWAVSGSGFTLAFEELCAYLAQITDQTSVTKLLGIDWRTVGAIVGRVVERKIDPSRLRELRRIGIDEFSYRKRHCYLTIVVDHDRRRVVWVGEGKSAAALARFFTEIGPEACRQLESVTMDMSEGYQRCVREHAPQAAIVFDRFHVQKLAGDALDQVRRQVIRDMDDGDLKRALKCSRWPLLKNADEVTDRDARKLSDVERSYKPLYRAYLLKEALRLALSRKQPWRARRDLREWIGWAVRSRLEPFKRVGRTVSQHLEGIMAYIELRLTNGLVEGINAKSRMIARRAYGFHSAHALAAMIMLCSGGIDLAPALP
jgi:transposase